MNDMRDIKFRAWNGEFDHFDYFDLLGDFDDHSYYELGNKNVEQFTGLTDKNGKDIYEGDVLKTDTVNQYVVYREDMALFCMRINKLSGTTSIPSACEVIGNIHENPELIN